MNKVLCTFAGGERGGHQRPRRVRPGAHPLRGDAGERDCAEGSAEVPASQLRGEDFFYKLIYIYIFFLYVYEGE